MIRLKNVYKQFDEKQVISGLNLLVEDGRTLAVFGESGSGKTTLLRLIAGLERPDSGTVEAPGRLSMVFQEHRLLPWRNVIDNVILSGCNEAAATDLLSRLGLFGEESSDISSLSGGMAQRVSIARALGADPDILLLDEPFTGLDRESAHNAIDVIKSSVRDTCCIVLVSHDRELCEYMADDILLSSELKK